MKTRARHISELLPQALHDLEATAAAMASRPEASRADADPDESSRPRPPAPTAGHLLLHRRSAA